RIAVTRMSIRPSVFFAGIASADVAVAVFTNSSPAAAQASSGTPAGLSNIRHEICFGPAQSNRRKSRADSVRRRLRRAGRANRVVRADAQSVQLRTRQIERSAGGGGVSGVPKIAGSATALLGLALSLVAPLVALLAPAPARGQQMTSTPSRPWLDPALLP